MELRLALRLAVRVVAVLLLAVTAAFGLGDRLGTRPVWVVVAVGLPGILLAYAYLRARISGADPPLVRMWRTAKRCARLAQRLVRRGVAAVHRARCRGRVRRVELAALEAAKADERLSPERVRASAEALFRLVALAWDAGDSRRLADLLDADVLAQCEGRLAGVRHGRDERPEVVGEVRVGYVGLTLPRRGHGARAVVLIEATVSTRAGNLGRRAEGELRDVCQYWSLGLRDGLWTVLGIDERAKGGHHLVEAIGAPCSGGATGHRAGG